MSVSPDRLDSARFLVRNHLLNSRFVGGWYLRHRAAYADRVIGPSTRLVIEGFPRSANSYARWAFESVHPGEGKLAGHTHSSAMVRDAVHRGIPVVVIVREPGAAVASFVQMGAGAGLRSGFDAYARFHEGVAAVADGVLVAPFADVVGDFGAVLSRVNARFGVGFALYQKTPASEARVLALLEDANRRHNDGQLAEASVSRPSSGRSSSAQLLSDLDAPTQASYEKAQRTYRLLLPDG